MLNGKNGIHIWCEKRRRVLLSSAFEWFKTKIYI